MPKQKKIGLECPAYDCSGGDFSRLHRIKDPSSCKVPEEIRIQEKTGNVLYRCFYCGFLWYQKETHKPGYKPTAVGFYDNIAKPNEFWALPNHPIKQANIGNTD